MEIQWGYLGFIVIDFSFAIINLVSIRYIIHENVLEYNSSKWWYVPNTVAAIGSIMMAGFFTGKMLGI
jgi:hypothetical protein